MIIVPKSPVLRDEDRQGVWVPDIYAVGRAKQSGIKPIDLTAEALDNRVTYAGPSHSYLASDSTMKQSTANQWPLEYRNGVAVGRHEPEKASLNYVPGVEYGSIAQAGAGAVDWNYGTTGTPTVVTSDMGIATAISTKTGALTAVYSESSNTFIAAAQDGGPPTAWTRIKRQFTNNAQALLRWYVARVSGTDYLLARCAAVPAGSFTASVYRKVTDTGLLSAGAQLEAGDIVTSPIISPTGIQASRPASTVTLKRDGNATSAIVHFSNNETLTLPFNGADSVSIPVSTLDWGSRYMTRIEYEA